MGAASLRAVQPLFATLPNGLRIVATCLPGTHRVSCSVHLKVGPRYESEGQNGISHLLEHMLYRGIPGHPTAHDQALAFESLGGTLSAATGPDTGSIAVSCPAENFQATLSLLGAVYTEPLLGGLEVEKRIVREEILEDLDEAGALVDDYGLLRNAAFDGHPLGFPITGTPSHVDRFTEADLRRHHERHYVGCGTVVSVAGPLDPEVVARHVEACFASLRAGAPPTAVAPPASSGPKTVFVESSSSQSSVRVGFRAAGFRSADYAATEAIVRLLDDGNATRLYARLGDELGLVYDVAAGYDVTEDAGLLDVGCDATHGEAPPVLAEILAEICRLREEGPEPTELARVKARHRWSLLEMLDSTISTADFFADATLREYATSLEERQEVIEAVTRQSMVSAADSLFRARNMTAVVVGPKSRRGWAKIADSVRRFT